MSEIAYPLRGYVGLEDSVTTHGQRPQGEPHRPKPDDMDTTGQLDTARRRHIL
jgi:hypothetical protein